MIPRIPKRPARPLGPRFDPILAPQPTELKINADILTSRAYRAARRISPGEAWQLYAPPYTWGASDADRLAMDDHLQACGYHSLISHAVGLGMGLEEIAPQFLGYAYLAGLSQNGLIRAGVTTVAEEMTKRWVEVKRGNQSGKNDEKVKTLTAALKDFNVQGLFNEAAQKCDFDGGCLLFIDTGEKDDEILQQPLSLDPLLWNGKKVKSFKIIDAFNLYPGLYNATDPLRDDYFTPSHWLVLGRKVHTSRFLYFAPNTVNFILRPAYNFFGIPAAQLVLDYVAHFTKTREAAQRLLTKFSLTVLKSDMDVILNGGASTNFDMRMEYLAQWRDNDMILAIDKEKEDIIKLETPLAGVVDIVRQSLEFVSAIFRLPLTKFLGISPAGLNATGEGDLRNFYDHIQSKQEKMLKHPLNNVMDVLQLHCFGEIDPDICAEFCPLSDEDDAQKAMTQKTKADRLVALTQGGLIAEDEARRALKDDPESGFNFINPDEIPTTAPLEGEAGEPEAFAGGLEAGEGYGAAADAGGE